MMALQNTDKAPKNKNGLAWSHIRKAKSRSMRMEWVCSIRLAQKS